MSNDFFVFCFFFVGMFVLVSNGFGIEQTVDSEGKILWKNIIFHAILAVWLAIPSTIIVKMVLLLYLAQPR